MSAYDHQMHHSLKDRSFGRDAGTIRFGGWPLPEMIIVMIGAVLLVALSLWKDVPVRVPSRQAMAFLGFHYLVSIATLFGWGAVILITRRSKVLLYYAIAFLCYLAILIIHFNLKLWVSLINPYSWDWQLQQSDNMVRPIVDMCMGARIYLKSIFGNIDDMYLFAFVAMFYISFCIHAIRDSLVFRKLVCASLMLYFAGAAGYLVMPAIGPFIYEAGLSDAAAANQRYMLALIDALKSGGVDWIATNGQANLLGGPAAMPSLHTAASGMFLIFAWRYERWLAVLYVPLFIFILIEAVATRWHYVADLVVGGVLALACAFMAELIYRQANGARCRTIDKSGDLRSPTL